MRTKLPLIFWLLLGLAQLAVPASMIWKSETVKRSGTEVRLALVPHDPADPFRGRYLALSFAIEREGLDLPPKAEENKELFLELAIDADGFAKAKALHVTAPDGTLYIRVAREDWHFWAGNSPRMARFRLPVQRYYVNEDRAAAIETEVRELTRRRPENEKGPVVFARALVLKGEVVLVGLEGPNGPLR